MPVLCLGRRPAWLEAWLKRWRGWSRPGQYGALALIILVAGTGMVAASVPLWNYLLQGRAEYWRPAWLMFLASPLTGGGPGQHLEFQLRIDSIPPLDFFPHGHSLMVETLGSSGLTGGLSTLAVVGAGLYGLWRRWRQAPDRVWLAALISGLAGACLHQLTDHFLGTPSFAFLFVLVSALALAPSREDEPPTLALKAAAPQATYHPAWLGLPIALVLGITIFALRGAGWNARGVELANQQDWATAAQAFRQAAMSDPALALYWENAAQASTRAGAVDQAIPLWAHAARLEPRWAIDAASLAALTKDAGQMEAALNLAPQSYLIALNVGVLREAQGDLAAAQVSYRRALEAAPNALVAEALFWRQTPARETALAAWQASRPKDQSLMGQGWAAYQAGDFERAREILAQYLQASPFSVPGHARLGRTELALGDLDRAEACLETGRNLQSITPLDGLELEMLRGDLAAARGDSRLAREADLWIFSIISDYTSTGGPGTYGNANRAWWLFHREGLPGDLIPQLMRADVTADIDKRLARLAQGYAAEGYHDNACFILAHAYHEAPVSESGQLHEKLCSMATRP
jgi:O-antigen ligase